MNRLVALLAVAAAVVPTARAETHVVNPDGTGEFPTIQAAIDAAEDGDVIELTDGVFMGDGNRMIDFQGKAVALRSLSGDPERSVIDADFESRILLFQSEEGPGTAVVDITIQRGYWDAYGAAALCGPGSAPSFVNCIFRENYCGHNGGAIACLGASPTISDCVFDLNDSDSHGGAIYCTDGASPTIAGCLFQDNQAGFEGDGGSGGAIYGTRDCDPLVVDCEFHGNRADGTGGAVSCSGELTACTISGNWASNGGGVSGHDLVITRCEISGNGALGDYGRGGGVRCRASLSLTASTLYRNVAAVQGSGVYCEPGAEATIEDCIIAFGVEEAVDCEDATATLRCCDVYGNEGGDWVGCIEDQLGQDGNICEDPLFCSRESCPPDLRLQDCSPCRPFPPENPECDLVGAFPVACEGSPATRSTWGSLKLLFRE